MIMQYDLLTLIENIEYNRMFEIDWKKFTVNVVIGYVISWLYFLVFLIFFRKVFGKVNGVFVAYLTSWLVWILTAYILQSMNPTGDIPNL